MELTAVRSHSCRMCRAKASGLRMVDAGQRYGPLCRRRRHSLYTNAMLLNIEVSGFRSRSMADVTTQQDWNIGHEVTKAL